MAALYSRLSATNPGSARQILASVEDRCESLRDFPLRGRARDDLLPGIRILPFEGKVTIAYRANAVEVEIVRIFFGGQDYERALSDPPDA